MSVQRVTFTAADEKFAPPSKEIDLSVIANTVFITVYEGSSDDLSKGRAKEYDVPEIALSDLIAALSAFGDVQTFWRRQRPEPDSSAVSAGARERE